MIKLDIFNETLTTLIKKINTSIEIVATRWQLY